MRRITNALRGINYTRLVTKLLIAGSVTVLALTAYFVYQLDVLTDWRVTVPTNQEIHAGDTIVIESVYTKLRDVSGEARRYVECQTRPGVYVSYLVNEVRADRRAGKGGTGVEVPIPRGIANLPTTCRVRISIEYKVLPFRTVVEVTNSNEFKLLPETEESRIRRESENATQSTTRSTPVPVPSSSQNVSSSQNTSRRAEEQQELLQESAGRISDNTVTPEQPGVLQSTIDAVRLLIDNVIKGATI